MAGVFKEASLSPSSLWLVYSKLGLAFAGTFIFKEGRISALCIRVFKAEEISQNRCS